MKKEGRTSLCEICKFTVSGLSCTSKNIWRGGGGGGAPPLNPTQRFQFFSKEAGGRVLFFLNCGGGGYLSNLKMQTLDINLAKAGYNFVVQ